MLIGYVITMRLLLARNMLVDAILKAKMAGNEFYKRLSYISIFKGFEDQIKDA